MPDYLRLPLLGVDVSGKSIKYIELENSPWGTRLKNFGSKKIEKSAIEKGEIRDKETLIKSLKIILEETGNKYIAASLPEEKAFIKVVKLPLMDLSKVRSSIELQLEELIPFSPEDVVYDFEVVNSTPPSGASNGEFLEVVLSAFPKKITESYLEIFEKAGFFPVVFELENHSIFRSVVNEKQKDAVVVVDFGKTRTSFLAGEDGVVKFGSTVNVAGGHIDNAISKNLNISVFEAEKIKYQTVLQKTEGDAVLNAIFPVISVIKDEIKQVMDYWESYSNEQGFKNKKIKKIILCGGDSNMRGLVEYLSYGLNTPIEIANVWTNIFSFDKYIPEIKHRESLSFPTAIGLALRNFK